jgi:hypothetical protein
MERAYDLIVDGMTDDAEPSDMVGEKSHVLSFSKGPIVTVKVAEVVFVKCNTLVSISMVGTDNTTSVIAYAKRLESRLEPLVCH